ncbi:MAG: type II toxin-antitoxin system VapC family toxin [Bacteroidota bacterium]
MRVLIDTHVLLWFLTDPDRLSRTAYGLITTPENEVLLSVGSLWEIAIKLNVGKLTLEGLFEEVIPSQLVEERIEVLPTAMDHLAVFEKLPLYHRDPFDRLLVAQAMAEGMPIVTRDAAFDRYAVEVLWEKAEG